MIARALLKPESKSVTLTDMAIQTQQTTIAANLLGFRENGGSALIRKDFPAPFGMSYAEAMHEMMALNPVNPGYYFLYERDINGDPYGQLLTVVSEGGTFVVKQGIEAPAITPRLSTWPPRKPR